MYLKPFLFIFFVIFSQVSVSKVFSVFSCLDAKSQFFYFSVPNFENFTQVSTFISKQFIWKTPYNLWIFIFLVSLPLISFCTRHVWQLADFWGFIFLLGLISWKLWVALPFFCHELVHWILLHLHFLVHGVLLLDVVFYADETWLSCVAKGGGMRVHRPFASRIWFVLFKNDWSVRLLHGL